MSPSPLAPESAGPVSRPLTRSQRLDRLPFTRKHGKLLGTPDPGAISFSKIVTLLAEKLSA